MTGLPGRRDDTLFTPLAAGGPHCRRPVPLRGGLR